MSDQLDPSRPEHDTPPPPPAPRGDTPAAPSPYGQAPYPGAPAPQDPAAPVPYGQTAPYGQAPAPAYDGAMVPTPRYSSWLRRVGASLLDSLLSLLPLLLLGIPAVVCFVKGAGRSQSSYDSTGAYTSTTTGENPTLLVVGGLLLALAFLASIAIGLWNRVFRMGRTGQSWGKAQLGQRLIDENTGQPMGAGMCFVRELAHNLDSLFGYFPLGYLWPLWDAKRQTWADKILHTVVVDD